MLTVGTQERLRVLLREFHDLQKERVKRDASIKKIREEILFIESFLGGDLCRN